MCGILGVCSPQVNQYRDAIVRAGAVIAHRGPDGEGVYDDPNCVLLHKRLAIIDLNTGSQPIFNEKEDLALVFNGEIYNYKALTNDLEARGHRFKTHSDSEAIIHLFEEGLEALKELRGMFAFAVWDKRERSLFLMRDRVGIKPLYYSLLGDGTLVFCSEIKGILATGLVQAVPNKEAIREYLNYKFTFGKKTFFKNIFSLEPGHVLEWRDGKVAIKEYWRPNYDLVDKVQFEFQEEFEFQIKDSIKHHLVSDVPLGAFLSGGLDSSAIAKVSADTLQGRIKTYTCGTADETRGDLHYSRIVADKVPMDHHEFLHTSQEFGSFMKQCIWHLDEPGGGSTAIHGYYISKRARQDVKVLLSGEGADEVLGGYYHHWLPHYRSLSFRQRVMLYPSWKQWGGLASRGKDELFFPNHQGADEIFMARHQSPVFGQPGIFNTGYFQETAGYDPRTPVLEMLSDVKSIHLTKQLMHLDLKSYLSRIIHIYDRMCMAVSLENRVPFLDHKFLDFCFSVPVENLLHGMNTKALLREMLRKDLDAEIAFRPKAGFSLPVDQWFRGPLAGQVKTILTDLTKREIFEAQFLENLLDAFLSGGGDREDIWRLVSLEFWFQNFID